MGEVAVSNTPGDELVAIGLGSCIGLVIADRHAAVAGLAHVVLPDAGGKTGGPAGKFADLAVRDLVSRILGAGGSKPRLQAVMIGGASMFAVGTSMDIGARNCAAVLAELDHEGVPLVAQEIGGSRGRTARVVVGEEVSFQAAGDRRTLILSLSRTGTGSHARRPSASGHQVRVQTA
ncbi:MAG: chemotaxis protein CheD [Solirubrobacteraceae bacterium]